jgi:hypothetical protein
MKAKTIYTEDGVMVINEGNGKIIKHIKPPSKNKYDVNKIKKMFPKRLK